MTNRIANLAFGALIALGLIAVGLSYGQKATSAAALDCTDPVNLQVLIYDNGRPEVNGGLLSLPGAYVDFSENIQTGGYAAIRYYDNQNLGPVRDDNDRRGIIEERTACRDLDTLDVVATLGFTDLLDCTIIGGSTRSVELYDDVVVEFTVDDCERVAATATPTATPVPPTATAVPATATPVPATATSVPVATPFVPFACPSGAVVNLAVQSCPVVPPVVVAPVAPAAPVTPIRPPSTGSAGLAAAPGDEGGGRWVCQRYWWGTYCYFAGNQGW